MATHTCNQNCGCKDTYTVTAPCPPACPEVFNSQCIVYTGTDIICNTDTVIKRYDYLDTVITKLVNYICNVQAPITNVVGSEYIDVVPATVGNTTTYTVSVDVPALQAYFDTVFQNDILSSILAGPGILISQNPIVGTVTISHQDTSSVADVNSDNSGNTFIQDVFFTFDTYGHVTGASVVPGTVIPQNTFDRATVNPDSGFVWGPDNDPTNIQIAEAANDALNFVAGTGIILNGSTVPSTDAIRITNSAPDQVVVLNEGTGIDVTGAYPNFTITNTAPNVNQNLWATIAATSGSTTANSTTDTLTVVGAGGITTSIAGDTLTITGSGGGGSQFTYEIGQYVASQGGVIAHRWLSNGSTYPVTSGIQQCYLVVDTALLTNSAQWASAAINTAGAADSSYSGVTNTAGLIFLGAGAGITAGTAAVLCDNSTNNGKTDWFLPAIDELSVIWQNRWAINQGLQTIPAGPLSFPFYWSSTEATTNVAWTFDFTTEYLQFKRSYRLLVSVTTRQ